MTIDFVVERPDADASALGEHLIHRGAITPYQLQRILAGLGNGLVLGPYVILDAVGSADLGVTYRAVGCTPQQYFALKILPNGGPWSLTQARRRAQFFADPVPPTVVPLADAGISGDFSYLAWPFVGDETLESRVARGGPMSVAQTLRVAVDLVEALAYLQRQQVWHGSINPQAIRVAPDGRARLMDLGLGALFAEGDLEPTGLAWPDCAAPETLVHSAYRSMRADQYALGCTLYFALVGRYPFAGRTPAEISDAHRRELIPELPLVNAGVSPELVTILRRLASKDPLERYETPSEIDSALAPLTRDDARTSPTPLPPVEQRRPRVSPLLRQIRGRMGDDTPPPPVRLEQTPLPRALADVPEPPATSRRSMAERIMEGFRIFRGTPQAVEVALLGPDRLLPGDIVLLQVVAFPAKQIDQSRRLSDWRGSLVLPRRLSRGSKLALHLGLVDVNIGDGWRELTWHGEAKTITFKVHVPNDWQAGQVLEGVLNLAADSIPSGKIQFRIPIFGRKPTPAWK